MRSFILLFLFPAFVFPKSLEKSTTVDYGNPWTDKQIIETLLKKYRFPESSANISVSVGIQIEEIDDLDDDKCHLSMLITQKWVEYSLQYKEYRDSLNPVKFRSLNYIWNPVLTVDNSIALTPISKDSIRVYSNGLVEYVHRMKLTVPSEHNLKKFPFETRNCTIHFTNDDSRAVWSKIINIKFPREDSISKWIPLKSETVSNYHNLRLRMQRSVTNWTYTYFLPTFLLVVVSWLPGWMNTRAQIARISVGAVCFFSILVLVLSKSTRIPSTPYLKAIDLWNLAICGFSFISFIQTAIVISHTNSLSRSRRNRSFDDDGGDTEKSHWISDTPYYSQLSPPNSITTPKICDYIFRFVAPICFGIFVAFFIYVYSTDFWTFSYA